MRWCARECDLRRRQRQRLDRIHSRCAAAGARPRRDPAGRRLALHRRLGRRLSRARRGEGGAAGARPWACRLRRPPQHPRPSPRAARSWVRRRDGQGLRRADGAGGGAPHRAR